MKTYRSFPRVYIGTSDMAELILSGYDKSFPDAPFYCHRLLPLCFVEDSTYYARFIVNHESSLTEIPDHYHLVASFDNWLTIYDDEGKTFDFYSESSKINVYRAGDSGCIIHCICSNRSYDFNKQHREICEKEE